MAKYQGMLRIRMKEDGAASMIFSLISDYFDKRATFTNTS